MFGPFVVVDLAEEGEPDDAVLYRESAEWTAFVDGVKMGEFEL